jgi:hypothetical protein
MYKCLHRTGCPGIIVDQSSPETRGGKMAQLTQYEGKCLNDVYLWGDSGPHITAGKDINEAMMEQASFNGAHFIRGRALVEKSKITMRTVKKAMALLTSKLNKNGGELTTGYSMEDLHKKSWMGWGCC